MKVHNIVSVAQLKPTIDPDSDKYNRRPPPPSPTVVDNKEEWKVERLLRKRSRRIRRAKTKSIEYLIRWTGHSPEHDIWISLK